MNPIVRVDDKTDLVYIIDNQPFVGNIRKYAHDYREAELTGTSISRSVWHWISYDQDGESHSLFVERHPTVHPGTTDDDWQICAITLDDAEGIFIRDLRA